MTILVTGGAGFIGSNFVLDWLTSGDEPVVNLDLLTYAGNACNLEALRDDNRHVFVKGDINDYGLVLSLLRTHQPRALINFAAESHVDRSIHDPATFIYTNVVGTYTLLEASRHYWSGLPEPARRQFRFLQIGTDEVYGSLAADAAPVMEDVAYQPNSPYSASKAASNHLVRAWAQTYGLPALTATCSNSYGPYQFPEKLIPLVLLNAIRGNPLPIYGDGRQVRDWLYVGDSCTALRAVLESGQVGKTYNIGGRNEQTNNNVVKSLCELLDELRPCSLGPYSRLIAHVADRPGHDRRYAMDTDRIEQELHWRPKETFQSGLRKTVIWYLDHPAWLPEVHSGSYQDWIGLNYSARNRT